jgi:hypothetical protein
LTSATLLPPIAVNPREADPVADTAGAAGAAGTNGATEAALHLLEPQPPNGAACSETNPSKRNEAIRRHGIVFIVERCCVPYYLRSGQKDNRVKAA